MAEENSYYEQINFDPASMDNKNQIPIISAQPSAMNMIAEQSIIETIMDGVSEEYRGEISMAGLRFIRYILSISRSARFGFLPNFRDIDTVREIARQFIKHCGSSALALYTMNKVIEKEAY